MLVASTAMPIGYVCPEASVVGLPPPLREELQAQREPSADALSRLRAGLAAKDESPSLGTRPRSRDPKVDVRPQNDRRLPLDRCTSACDVIRSRDE